MENREYQSVHDAHCCPLHGCKYTHPDCPVEKHREGGIACESCYYDFADDRYWEIAYLMNEVASRVSGERVREACIKVLADRVAGWGNVAGNDYAMARRTEAKLLLEELKALPLAAQPEGK